MTSKCPSFELLAAFLEHSLAPHELALIERHLSECRDCRETIRLVLSREDESADRPD